jgi:hypothetical protein
MLSERMSLGPTARAFSFLGRDAYDLSLHSLSQYRGSCNKEMKEGPGIGTVPRAALIRGSEVLRPRPAFLTAHKPPIQDHDAGLSSSGFTLPPASQVFQALPPFYLDRLAGVGPDLVTATTGPGPSFPSRKAHALTREERKSKKERKSRIVLQDMIVLQKTKTRF